MASPQVEVFSLSHAQVLDGSTSFDTAINALAGDGTALDIYAVSDGKLTAKNSQYENKGDDAILSVWNWLDNADLSIESGYFSFNLINTITGNTVSSSGAGATQLFSVEVWNQKSMNVAPRPVLLVSPSKDAQGNVRRFFLCVYRLNFSPLTFTGPTYKDGLKVSYAGQAVATATDETGTPFADGDKHVLKVVSMK